MRKLPSAMILTMMLFLVIFHVNSFADQGAYAQIIDVQVKGISREVKTVRIDLGNPFYRINVALAKGQIGEVDVLAHIAAQMEGEETEVVAAVNGTFFNAYSDMQPVGNIYIDGESKYISNQGTAIGFTVDNQIEFAHLNTSLRGSVNGNWEYPYNWSVWGINQIYSRTDANIMYTPEFGEQVNAGEKTAIIVRNKKVVAIQKGISPIYHDGYTLVFGAQCYACMFKIGDRVDYKLEYCHNNFSKDGTSGEPLDWTHIRNGLGAGPMLVQDGEIVLDALKEGFTDEKFTTKRARRSFIGETQGRILVMGTVCDVTLDELAEIMMSLHLVNAMNLDGGASSGLIFQGTAVTEPGREVSNAIVVTKKKTKPVRIQLNGKELYFDTEPYFEDGTVMVPLRGMMEALEAEVGWEQSTGTIWTCMGDNRLEMWNDSKQVKVNGVYSELPVAVQVKHNRTHVPAKFITELFGGTISFDTSLNLIAIDMSMANPSEVYEKAIIEYEGGHTTEAEKLFLEVLKMEPKHAGAILKLARYYASLGNQILACEYFERFVEIQPEDESVLNSLGWTYYTLNRLQEAKNVFIKLTNIRPDAAAYWMALGDVYFHYQIQDIEHARECYQKALHCNPNNRQKETIQSRMEKLTNPS